MTARHQITRKEIAAELGVSVDTVERHEKLWGLDKVRAKTPQKPVAYWAGKVRALLTKRGLLAE